MGNTPAITHQTDANGIAWERQAHDYRVVFRAAPGSSDLLLVPLESLGHEHIFLAFVSLAGLWLSWAFMPEKH